jgi:tyrosinase
MTVDQRFTLSHAVREFSRRRVLRASAAGVAAAALGSRLVTGGIAQESATPAATPAATTPDGLRVRPNAATLSDEQKFNYVNAVLALKKKPSPWLPGLSTYDTFVIWHRDAFTCGLNSAHMGSAFFPWHRQYLLLFEEQLQSVDPTVNLPYWDWTVDNTVDSYVWQPDFMGGDGSDADNEAVIDGPFQKGKWEINVFDYSDIHKAPYITRDLGRGGLAPDLPTAEQLEATLAIDTYDAAPWNAQAPIAQSFRNAFEGWRDCVDEMCDPVNGTSPVCTGDHTMHNRVHLWVSGEFIFAHEAAMSHAEELAHTATPVPPEDDVFGTMAANSSPNDPVFFQHHANIDRVWNLWMTRHGQNYLPESGGPLGQNIDDQMWPYDGIGISATPRKMLDSRALGYVYDTDLE